MLFINFLLSVFVFLMFKEAAKLITLTGKYSEAKWKPIGIFVSLGSIGIILLVLL